MGFAFLLYVIGVGLHGILLCGTLQEASLFLLVLLIPLALAVLVARKCLWGKPPGVSMHFVPLPPDADENDEGESGRPPDAPRPAPLRPHRPRALSAAADLLYELELPVAASGLKVPAELKEVLREALPKAGPMGEATAS